MHLSRGAIQRYLAHDVSSATERRTRRHLGGCARCRATCDEESALLRALAGDAQRATPAEDARIVRQALAAAGLSSPRPQRSLFDAMVDAPVRFVLVGAAILLLLVGGGIWLGGSIRGAARQPAIAKRPPTAPALSDNVAGSLAMARGVTVDGRSATSGDVLAAGSEVAVGVHGLAEIDVMRGGRIRLYPGAHVALSPRGEVVALEQGKVWCQVDKGRGRFAVRTDRAEARVLGTSFVVDRAASGDTDVRVLEGTVEVEDADRHGSVRVKGGQRTQVIARSAPSEPRSYDGHSDSDEWKRFFDEIGRALDDAFKQLKGAFK